MSVMKTAQRFLESAGLNGHITYSNPLLAFHAVCALGNHNGEPNAFSFHNGVLAVRTKNALAWMAGVELNGRPVYSHKYQVYYCETWDGGYNVAKHAKNDELVASLNELPVSVPILRIWPAYAFRIGDYLHNLPFALSAKALGTRVKFFFTPIVFTIGQLAEEAEHLNKYMKAARAFMEMGAEVDVWSADFSHSARTFVVGGEEGVIKDLVEELGLSVIEHPFRGDRYRCTVEVKRD